MRTSRSACLLLPLVLNFASGCASSPSVAPTQPPSKPAEMTVKPPPPGYFLTTLDAILSRSWRKPSESLPD